MLRPPLRLEPGRDGLVGASGGRTGSTGAIPPVSVPLAERLPADPQ